MERDSVDRLNEDLASQYPAIDPAVEGIVNRIHRLSKYIKKSLGETAATLGLTIEDWDIIGNLHCLEGTRTMSPGRLSEKVQLSSGAMTNRLDRLERAGLIRRRPDPDDRRGIRVEPTETANELWARAVDIQAAKEKMFAQPLTPEEKEELNGLLRKMMLSFEQPQPREPAPTTGP
ncbi:MAG: MarR family winged helix-turn-helix transcriptional regulator [Actinomycetota bacterium]